MDRLLPVFRLLVAFSMLGFVQQSPATTPADAIFARAVTDVQNDATAPYATYTVVVTVTANGRRVSASWRTTEDIRHRIVLASSFSDEERANPTTPHGINVAATRRFPVASLRTLIPDLNSTTRWENSNPVNAERTGDLVGPVALAVDQNFGLTPPRTYRIADDDRTMVSGGDELTVIGRTGTAIPRYRVALLDTNAGIAHLQLTPLRDAYHNRLRELWVDVTTASVKRAIVQGVGDRAPFDRALWQATFERREGATYLTEVVSLQPLRIGRNTVHVNIGFEHVDLLANSPITTTFGIEAPVRYLRDPG